VAQYVGSVDCVTGPTTAGEAGHIGWYGDLGAHASSSWWAAARS